VRKSSPTGIGIAARVTGWGGACLDRSSAQEMAAVRIAPARSPIATQAARSRRRLVATTGAATPACEPACAIQASSRLMS
jgi:hypothetical protein